MSALSNKNYDFDYDFEEENQQLSKKRVIKKKNRNKITLGTIKNWILVVSMFGLSILIIFNYATITEKKMTISKLEDEITALNDDIDGYNIFLESLNNTNMIENMAKSYLGMNYPSRKQTVFLNVTQDENNVLADINENNSNVSFLEKAIRLFQ